MERTWTCSSNGNRTRTPYFWFRTIEHRTSNIVRPITSNLYTTLKTCFNWTKESNLKDESKIQSWFKKVKISTILRKQSSNDWPQFGFKNGENGGLMYFPNKGQRPWKTSTRAKMDADRRSKSISIVVGLNVVSNPILKEEAEIQPM